MMIRILFFLTMILMAAPAQAKEGIDIDSFARLPVQHEGRIKPIDTLARAYLENFSGHNSLDGMGASEWLAESLFDPASAIGRPLFRVLKPDTIGLEPRKGKLYSFAEISTALSKKSAQIAQLAQSEPKSWSEDQRDLMRLHEQSILFMQILRSFSMILPLDITVPGTLAKEWKIDTSKPMTYAALGKHETALQARVEKIIRRKGDNPDRYTDSEKEIAAFAYAMQSLRVGSEGNVLFRIIPTVWEGGEGTWFSPWALGESGKGSPESAQILKLWEEMGQSYLHRDNTGFDAAAQQLQKSYAPYIYKSKTAAEMTYNTLHPIGFAMAGYLLAFFAFAAAAIFARPRLIFAGTIILGLSAALHSMAIGLRVYILERPPVGTLYESILFVAAICATIALIIELRRKDGIGLLMGSITALLLLFTAQAFDGEDTMRILVAVLNTNFWLATHVLCITTGYGLCLITAAIAHMHLFRAATGRDQETLIPIMKTTGLISLLFTAVGTILGGIWADQSWGRFWGWDPKENGALLIVLWLIWIYHGHLSGHLKHLSLAASMAALNIVVALAWFGVNLLNVGLHSYGFITGVALVLGAFCTAEAAIIATLWHRAAQRKAAA